MKRISLHLSLTVQSRRSLRALSTMTAAFGLILCAIAAEATVRSVPSQYSTIQDAIKASVKGDTVLVAPGVYYGPGDLNLDPMGKAITIKSKNGPQNCILSGSYSYQGFNIHSGETAATKLIGFTFYQCAASQGVGIFLFGSSPTLSNCVFEYDFATDSGGGIFIVNNSSPTLSNCSFIGNATSASGIYGGGLYLVGGKAKVSNCVFEHNQANGWGGALLVNSDKSVLTNCIFLGNSSTGSGYGGGAVCALGSSLAVFTNCDFDSNIGDYGGGMLTLSGAAPTLNTCTFTSNTARINGGGLYLDAAAPAKIVDTNFYNNAAAGFSAHAPLGLGGAVVILGSNPSFTNCQLEGNFAGSGGAIYLDSVSPTFTGCLFVENTADNSANNTYGGGAICVVSSSATSAPQLTGCSFYNNTGWNGGGILATGNLNLTDCQFYNGSAGGGYGGGVALLGGTGIFVNSVFANNSATTGGGALYFDGSATIGYVTNCTFSANFTGVNGVPGSGDGVLTSDSAGATFFNCIVWDPDMSAFNNDLVALIGAGINALFSDVYGGFLGAGDINADPQFVSASTDDFVLQSASPCLGAGSSQVPNFPSIDITGAPRNTTHPSMGAYEN